MSLTGALSSAISALSAQSQSLAMISDNIANSQTTGYKTNSAAFEDLVTNSSSASTYSSGGVTSAARANITQQGLLATTTTATDVAIQGSGFFAVTTALTGGSTLYTRDGAFTTDKSGYLVNNGSYLLGERTDASGTVTDTSLVPINTNIAPTNGSPTSETTFAANLPSDAAVGATFTSSMSVYDSLGTASTVSVTWAKTATNSWTASFGAPTLASDSSVTTGGVPSGGPITITFNSDGSLATPTTTPAITIPWTDGANTSSPIKLNLGTVGKTDGLTQLASGATTPAVSVTSITSDGVARGQLSSIAVGDNGTVNATYSNGQTIAIYKIPVALFNAPDALQAKSGGLYAATAASGNATIQTSGQNGAGTVYGSELESSTTDTNTSFSSMISAQQAYSAASQVITAANKMFDTLISAMR